MIAPPEGFQSIRCWEFPGVPGDPEVFERLESGVEVWIEDHFEWGKESWAETGGGEADDCWLPLSQLQTLSGMMKKEPPGKVDTFRREFDLSLEDSQSEAARTLRDAGLLVAIEPGGEIVGVALSLYPEEVESIPILVGNYQDDGSILDDQTVALLKALRRSLPEQPFLNSFFAAHPDEEEVDATSDEEEDATE